VWKISAGSDAAWPLGLNPNQLPVSVLAVIPSSRFANGFKTFPVVYALVVLSLCTPCSLKATILLRDSFDYPDGSLLNGLVNPSGQTWEFVGGTSSIAVAPSIAAGSLSYPGLSGSSGNRVVASNDFSASGRIALGQTVSSGTLYYSLIFQVSDITGLVNTTTGSFFAGLNTVTGPGTTGPAVAAAGMLVRLDPENPAAFNLGTTVNGSTTEPRVFDPTDHFEGEIVFLVASYTFNPGAGDDVARLYVNPDISAFASGVLPSPSAEATGSDVTTGSLMSVFLRNNTVEPQQIYMDELRVGTSPIDVVPEPSSALLLLGTAALLAGTRQRRRLN